MGLITGRGLPAEAREFLVISLAAFWISIAVLVALLLAAATPDLRLLTLGYDINPLVGFFLVACTFALLIVAIVEADDVQGTHRYGRASVG